MGDLSKGADRHKFSVPADSLGAGRHRDLKLAAAYRYPQGP